MSFWSRMVRGPRTGSTSAWNGPSQNGSYDDATDMSVVTTGRETVAQTGLPQTSHESAIDLNLRKSAKSADKSPPFGIVRTNRITFQPVSNRCAGCSTRSLSSIPAAPTARLRSPGPLGRAYLILSGSTTSPLPASRAGVGYERLCVLILLLLEGPSRRLRLSSNCPLRTNK
jgi:hypothetical protein